MKCQVCHGKMAEKEIKLDFWHEEELIVIDHVPAYECPQCGEQVFRPEVSNRIRALADEKSYEQIEAKLKHFPHEELGL